MEWFTTIRTALLFVVSAVAVFDMATPVCFHTQNQMSAQEQPLTIHCSSSVLSATYDKTIAPVRGDELQVCYLKLDALKSFSCTLRARPDRVIAWTPFSDDHDFLSNCVNYMTCYWVAAGNGLYLWNDRFSKYNQPPIAWGHGN